MPCRSTSSSACWAGLSWAGLAGAVPLPGAFSVTGSPGTVPTGTRALLQGLRKSSACWEVSDTRGAHCGHQHTVLQPTRDQDASVPRWDPLGSNIRDRQAQIPAVLELTFLSWSQNTDDKVEILYNSHKMQGRKKMGVVSWTVPPQKFAPT